MRLFYQAFPNCDAVRHELSWTHYRLLLRVDTQEARHWYMQEAATQNWSTRVLERQISTLYYDRLLSSPDQEHLQAKLQQAAQPQTPRDFLRDPVMLEFLGLPDIGRVPEADLEQALMNKLQQFLYRLVLPTEEELRREIERERAAILENRSNNDQHDEESG
jgi:hypothetical protein